MKFKFNNLLYINFKIKSYRKNNNKLFKNILKDIFTKKKKKMNLFYLKSYLLKY